MKISRASRTRAERRTRWMHLARRLLSLLLLLLLSVPMFGGGVQAIWAIPAVLCICMNEGVLFSMTAGVLGGILIDVACDSLLASNAIFLACVCTAASLLFANLLRHTFLNFYLLTILCSFLRVGISFLCEEVLFHVPGRAYLWECVQLPSVIATLVVAIPVYLLFLPIARLLTKQVRSMDAAAIHRG